VCRAEVGFRQRQLGLAGLCSIDPRPALAQGAALAAGERRRGRRGEDDDGERKKRFTRSCSFSGSIRSAV
jgi:hypothetical protein